MLNNIIEPFVSIVIVNWNNFEDTIECILALNKLNYKNMEIIVVDNGSTDKSIEYLEKEGLNCRFIKNNENLGYGGGNNIGIKASLERGSDFIWLLNNDTVMEPEALNYLIRAALDTPSAALIGSKILYYDHRDIIWYMGANIDWKNGNSPHIGAGRKNEEQYEDINVVERVTGCSMMIRSNVIKDIGLMKEEYFMYEEDVEWCLRARKRGYSCIMANKSIVYHKIHKSINNNWENLFSYYNTRNFLYMINEIIPVPRMQVYTTRLILRKLYFNKKNLIKLAWEWAIDNPNYKYNNSYYVARGIIDYCKGISGKFVS